MSSREIRSYYKTRGNIKQDYYKKNLQNPFYNKRGDGHKKIFNLFNGNNFILAGIVILLIFLFWVFLFSSLFTIRDIKINGLTRTTEADVLDIINTRISERRCLVFSQENTIILNKSKLSKALGDKFGFLNVSTKKGIKGSLKIDIQEREYAFIWGENGDYYHIDKTAYVIDKIASNFTPISNLVVNSSTSSDIITLATSSAEQERSNIQKEALREVKKNNKNNYPIIDNLYNPIIKNNIVDIDPVYFNFITKISMALNGDPDKNLSISRFFVDSDIDTLKVELNTGLLIDFSTKQSPDDQINSLLILKDKLNKIIKKKVDLRYGDRIYYE